MNKSIKIPKCKLQPVSHKWVSNRRGEITSIDNVIIRIDNYPSALIHIDTFWEGKGKDNYVYDKLIANESVECEIEFHYEEEEE